MTTQELQAGIEKVKSQGCTLSNEEITTIILKEEANKSKREKRSSKKWAAREANKDMTEEMNAKFSAMSQSEFEQYNEDAKRKSFLAQRPSSMR
jgi:hypothetical protein